MKGWHEFYAWLTIWVVIIVSCLFVTSSSAQFYEYQKASDVSADTTYFDKNLTAADNTAQKAFDTLDDMVGGGAGDISSVGDALTGAVFAAGDTDSLLGKLIGIGATSPTASFNIVASSATLFALKVADSSTNDRLVVQQDGNVGIGTTNPSCKLDIAGDLNLRFDDGIYFGAYRILTFANEAIDRVVFGDGTTANDVMSIKQGKLGIGTIPAYTLHVAGTAAAQTLRFGTLLDNILPASTGAVNQVLKTGAAGVINWQDDATGAGGGGISVSGPNYGLTYKLNSTSIVAYNLFVTDPATSYIAAGTQATGAVQFYIQGQDTYTQLFDVRGSDRKSWLDVTPGNVGIGATGVAISGLQVGSSSNAMALQVYGTITGAALRTTNYALPANTGAASQVLTTTGGAVVWATPSGGGSTSFESTVPNAILHVTGAGNTGAGAVLMVWDVTAKELSIGSTDTSVSARLYVKGSGTTTEFALRIADSTPTDRVVVLNNGNVGIGTTAPIANLSVVPANTASLLAFRVSDTGGNTAIVVRADTGRIGIGTTAPAAKFHIVGTGTGVGINLETGSLARSPLEIRGTSTAPSQSIVVVGGVYVFRTGNTCVQIPLLTDGVVGNTMPLYGRTVTCN